MTGIDRRQACDRERHGRLYVISTPIGNLADISERAVDVLREVDVIAAEDTRHTGRLLERFAIETPMRSYHEHNERRVTAGLLELLREGRSLALVSDAGTPAVSDPGYRLLSAAAENGVAIVPVPGASAVLAALAVSGLPSDRFAFEGFLPKKKGRATRLAELAGEPRTLVVYESPLRLAGTLADLAAAFGSERRAAVCRELTKLHEQVVRGTLAELARAYETEPVRGEVTLVVEGRSRRVRNKEVR
ncbi:MAG: Ribosomal RNA small subunit methyltransferase I [Calditrichaeota bacterium]|nr:Ribosomal RNA small subunit methyltransferase I [Calditrichota bacterium]